MGDYTKLIITAELNVERKALEDKIKELPLTESYYHCSGSVIQIEEVNYYDEDKRILSLILVGQTKYGKGQEEFLAWLKPFVTKGTGERELWAIQMYEYGTGCFWYMDETEDSLAL